MFGCFLPLPWRLNCLWNPNLSHFLRIFELCVLFFFTSPSSRSCYSFWIARFTFFSVPLKWYSFHPWYLYLFVFSSFSTPSYLFTEREFFTSLPGFLLLIFILSFSPFLQDTVYYLFSVDISGLTHSISLACPSLYELRIWHLMGNFSSRIVWITVTNNFWFASAFIFSIYFPVLCSFRP